ncbi:MAG: hypothetical protein ACKPAJ_08000, partial [Actinomycetota bacterium]
PRGLDHVLDAANDLPVLGRTLGDEVVQLSDDVERHQREQQPYELKVMRTPSPNPINGLSAIFKKASKKKVPTSNVDTLMRS